MRCGICAESLAGRVVVKHPTQPLMVHKDCVHTVDFALNSLSNESMAVIIDEQAGVLGDTVALPVGLNQVPFCASDVSPSRPRNVKKNTMSV